MMSSHLDVLEAIKRRRSQPIILLSSTWHQQLQWSDAKKAVARGCYATDLLNPVKTNTKAAENST